MCRFAALGALFVQAVLWAGPQPPDATPAPLVLKSTSRAVQMEVFVTDPFGNPVRGLQKGDFAVTDNGRPREIRIFERGIDTNQTARGVYSNRLGVRDAPSVTAIVLDAVPRPEGLQNDPGIFAARSAPERGLVFARWGALSAIQRMAPGQVIALYAACPDLRIVQDYTSDPDRLAASLQAFVMPVLPRTGGKKPSQTVDALVPPMLSALRDVAARMSGASGRKSVVWLSQGYGTDLNAQAIRGATDSTAAAFNDANVPLYAVDTRANPTCENPARSGNGPRAGQLSIVNLTCSQPPDVSDEWMEYLARATGGRAFSGGKWEGVREYDAEGRFTRGQYQIQRGDHSLVGDAIRFAADDSRSAYDLGFYVPESELDGKVHKLRVTVPAKPRFEVRYRSGYTASANATGREARQEPASLPNPDEVGIDATVARAAGAKNEVQVSLALASETVTRTAEGVIVLEATFIQTNDAGKELAKIQETLRLPSPEAPTDMVPYIRDLKPINGAILLHIRIRDPATNRVGSLAIPISK